MKKKLLSFLLIPFILSSCSSLPNDTNYVIKKTYIEDLDSYSYIYCMVAVSRNWNFKGSIVKDNGKYYFINEANEFHISIYENTKIHKGTLDNPTTNFEGIELKECYIRVGNVVEEQYFNGDERYISDTKVESNGAWYCIENTIVDHALDIFYDIDLQDVKTYTEEHRTKLKFESLPKE